MTLSLLRCSQCGFIFADASEVTELVSLYEQMSDPGYEGSQEGRILQMRWLLRKARKVRPAAKSVLDVGAGSGLLVGEAQRLGLKAVGVEPSHSLVELASRLYGLHLVQGVFPHPALSNRRFDCIFLVDIIEHVANPVELLTHCASALAADGILIMITPNVDSVVARLLGRRWWHLRIAHVGYFGKASLAKAVERAGLIIVQQFYAKWFFRIGYLAERLECYLPVGWLNRLSRKLQPLEWVYNRVVPLNLCDSIVVILQPK
jgi:2-polyprenyl-3-methyl-5-hydroxy-6-metoxy-1,4-benzoquinol methylase